MNIDNIKKAVKIGVCYTKLCRGSNKIRCFGRRMGYGEFVDLTQEEYALYNTVSQLSELEMLERLDKHLNEDKQGSNH